MNADKTFGYLFSAKMQDQAKQGAVHNPVSNNLFSWASMWHAVLYRVVVFPVRNAGHMAFYPAKVLKKKKQVNFTC